MLTLLKPMDGHMYLSVALGTNSKFEMSIPNWLHISFNIVSVIDRQLKHFMPCIPSDLFCLHRNRLTFAASYSWAYLARQVVSRRHDLSILETNSKFEMCIPKTSPVFDVKFQFWIPVQISKCIFQSVMLETNSKFEMFIPNCVRLSFQCQIIFCSHFKVWIAYNSKIELLAFKNLNFFPYFGLGKKILYV